MPLKTATFEEQVFIPTVERDEEKPTTIYGIPLSKGQYDKYQDDTMAESIRSGRVRGGRKKALNKIYRFHISRITNVIIDGEFSPEITNPEDIVEFLSNLEDVETGNEIDNWILGISSLSEEDRKNSNGQSDSPSSEVKEKSGTAKSAKERE
jgi:hypothetical protein